ncbi:MAG: hypothetical protein FWB93_02815 [Oscillospiraceae bacterium]|nr:hypothetical protein [Oscillospiraceae bacterium]
MGYSILDALCAVEVLEERVQGIASFTKFLLAIELRADKTNDVAVKKQIEEIEKFIWRELSKEIDPDRNDFS